MSKEYVIRSKNGDYMKLGDVVRHKKVGGEHSRYMIPVLNNKDYEFVESIGICKRCGSHLYPSDIPGYKSQCFECDEDFYDFEQETEK